jgi:SAM-dependent methyltransferase
MESIQPVTVEQMYGAQQLPDDAVQAALDRSLGPRSSSSLYDDVAALGIGPEHTVLDIGARDARHGLELATRLGCRVIAVEPVDSNLADGVELIAAHDHGDLVELRQGLIEAIPVADQTVDLVFSRDVTSHLGDIDRALTECMRVIRRNGAMLVYQTFAGPRLEPREAAELYRDLATVPDRMDPERFEQAARSVGFTVESCEVIGSQWREAWEEDGSGRTSQQLLHAARLLRAADDLVDELGEITYRVELANALWGVYQMIGKLEPRVYVLRAPG